MAREVDINAIQLDEPQAPVGFREVDLSQIQLDPLTAREEEFGVLREAPPLTAGEIAKGAITEFPRSLLQLGVDIADPFIPEILGGAGPVNTAKNLGQLAVGLFNKFTPGTQPSEQAVDAIADFFKDRYGTVENIKNTVATDPAGFLADVSTIFTGIAGGAKIAPAITPSLAATSPLAGKLSKAASEVVKRVEPINFAAAPLKAITKATPQQYINKIFESSAKFTSRLPDIDRTRIVETALNEGIVLSRSGLKKLQRRKRNLLENVDDIIDEGVATGRGRDVIIKTEDLIAQLEPLKEQLLSHPLGVDFADKVDAFSDSLRKNPKIGKQMNLKQAQETKKILGKFFDENLDAFTKVTQAAQDSIRRGLRSQLENTFPEIKQLNKSASELIALEEVLEPAIARIRNRDILGLGSKIFAAGGLDAPARFLATLSESVLGDPKVKSRLAIVLNKVKKQPITPDDITTMLLTRQAAFQAGRLPDILEEDTFKEDQALLNQGAI